MRARVPSRNCLKCGSKLTIEGFRVGLWGVRAEYPHLLFSLVQGLLAPACEGHSFFEGAERFFQRQLAGFHPLDQGFELGQCLFERNFVLILLAHITDPLLPRGRFYQRVPPWPSCGGKSGKLRPLVNPKVVLVRRLWCLFLLFSPCAWSAGDVADPYGRFTDQDNGYNEALEVPWVEMETEVKKGPDKGSLTELENLHLPPAMRLMVDLEHLSVDQRDHVSRLWIVIRSDRGAENGSYEGIRCATGEYKVYAYYNPKGSKPLRVVKLPRWRAIRPNSWRAELAQETLCSGTNPRDPNDVRIRPQHEAGDYRSPYE